MVRRNTVVGNIDWVTVVIYIILVFLGWVNIYSAVYNEDSQGIFDISQRYGKQLVWIGAALVLAFFIIIIESRFYVFFGYLIYGIMLLLLISVLIFGTEVNGARSWFIIGGFGFQPGEFTKFATALALAKYISQYNFKMYRLKSLAIIGFIIFFPALLIFLQHDTGSALVYTVFILVLYREGLTGVVLFFILLVVVLFILALVISNTAILVFMLVISFLSFYIIHQKFKDLWKVVGVFGLIVAIVWGIGVFFNLQFTNASVLLIGSVISALVFLGLSIRKRLHKISLLIVIFFGSLLFTISVGHVFENVLQEHQQARIKELLGIESDPLGAGYNVNQSKIAIGSGGFLGKGFLNGTQTKFNFVPEQSTDFIFCTVGEEWGFLGAFTVITLFIFLFIRLIWLAERQRSVFSRVYGYSVATILFFHFMVNIGMTIGLMPVIGIPLPFFSYGGSSLWSFTILLFIFLRLDANRLDRIL